MKPDLTAQEYVSLRQRVGWPAVDEAFARRALNGSCYVAVARADDGVVLGLARVVGDGTLTFYIADVMVSPEAQGQHIGARLMSQVCTYLRDAAVSGATVALVPLEGREGFYERHGFSRAPSPFGDAMIWLEPLQGLLQS